MDSDLIEEITGRPLEETLDQRAQTLRRRDVPVRVEMSWDNTHEELMQDWMQECHDNARKHRAKAGKFKLLYRLIGIPACTIPVIAAGLTSVYPDDNNAANVGFMITIGLLNNLNAFVNPGKRVEQHQKYENEYNKLAQDITCELHKPRAFRQVIDVFQQKMRDQKVNLDGNAPAV